MMAKSSKKSAKPSRSSSKRAAPAKASKSVKAKEKEKPMPFYKLLTAEGWRRLMSKKKK